MAEERWHDFAKEKPSEDMEGRNFIVSNGHYEKIATWCGYWENEPFMGDRLCDEVVRWKFYFTPEEEKANDETRTEPKAMKCDELKEYYYYEDRVVTPATHMYRVYHADEVDSAIAELKARIQLDDDEMAGFLQLEEECGVGDLRNYIAELKQFAEDACLERDDNQNAIDELQAENAELKQKLESLKASHYAEMVDAGMREHRLKRALWLARAERAIAEAEYWYGHPSGMYYIDAKEVPDEEDDPYKRVKDSPIGWYKTWMNVERKCLKKAEAYK